MLLWFKLASHLHLTPQELQERVPSSQLPMWSAYLKWHDENNLLYLYLAMIAAEVRRSWVKEPKKVDTKDFILRKKPDVSRMTVEERTRRLKAFFGAALASPQKPLER